MQNLIALIVLMLVVACSGSPEGVQSELQAAGVCGPDGHVLATAAVGDVYVANATEIQSVAVSNGDVWVALDGDSWIFTVERRVSASIPLVIQLRDAGHATLCVELAGP